MAMTGGGVEIAVKAAVRLMFYLREAAVYAFGVALPARAATNVE
jgi:hypothetical protein